MFLNKRKWFSEMSTKTPCKLKSNTKRNMIKKPTPQNLNKHILLMSYRRKQITRGAKSFYSFSVHWSLYFRKSVTKQHSFATQKWHQKDASASSNQAAPSHTPPTSTRYTNNATRVEARPGNFHKTRWFVRWFVHSEHGSMNTRSQSLIVIKEIR